MAVLQNMDEVKRVGEWKQDTNGDDHSTDSQGDSGFHGEGFGGVSIGESDFGGEERVVKKRSPSRMEFLMGGKHTLDQKSKSLSGAGYVAALLPRDALEMRNEQGSDMAQHHLAHQRELLPGTPEV